MKKCIHEPSDSYPIARCGKCEASIYKARRCKKCGKIYCLVCGNDKKFISPF